MERFRKLALAQKAKLLESLTASPQSVLHAIIEGDRNMTKVVIDGEDPAAQSPNTVDGSSPNATSSSTNYSTEMVCAILRAIEESKIVTHLTVSNRSDAAEFVSALTPLLSKTLTLKHLKIDSVYFGDDLSLALFGALAKNSSLESASLCNIGLTTTQSVLLLLNHTQTLKSIDLSNNALDEESLVSMAEGLRMVNSHELRELKLVNNGVDDSILNRFCSVLEESVDFCPSLRLLDCGSVEGVTDTTRARANAVLDTRRIRAAELAKGSIAKILDTSASSDRASNNAITTATASPQKGADTKSDRGSDSATAVILTSARGEGSSSSPPIAAAEAASTSPRPNLELGNSSVHHEAPLTRKASDIPPAAPHHQTLNTASADIAAAVASVSALHEAKITQLALMLGDSQTQSAQLQTRLTETEGILATTKSDAKAIKDASKSMYTQFQQKMAATEATAASQLVEAATAIAALKDKMTEMAAASEKQRMAFDEAIKAQQAIAGRLTAENTVLREEYLGELRDAIAAQQRGLEDAADGHRATSYKNAETQTEAGEDGKETAKTTKKSSAASSKPYGATAYDDAVSDFAMVDRDEATDDQSRWKKDTDATHCSACHKEFTLTRRRHHCRRCGNIYCSDCIVKSKVDKENVCCNCARSESVLVANNAKK